jgi:hypothetical protein
MDLNAVNIQAFIYDSCEDFKDPLNWLSKVGLRFAPFYSCHANQARYPDGIEKNGRKKAVAP